MYPIGCRNSHDFDSHEEPIMDANDQSLSLPKWINQLQSPNSTKRLDAAARLSQLGAAASPAVGALIKTLRDEEAVVRKMATLALGDIGPQATKAVPELVSATEDDDPTVRRRAVVALGEIGTEDALTALEAIATGEDEILRQVAYESLVSLEETRKRRAA